MLLIINGLPLDRGGAENLDGLSESKQKEKEVNFAAVFSFTLVLYQTSVTTLVYCQLAQ